MDNKRLILVATLGFILILIYQAWEQQHAPPPPAASAPAKTAQPSDVPKAPDAPRTAQTQAAPATGALAHGERVEIVTDVFHASIDTQGGDLRDPRLRKHPVAIE